ncbi:hypothetical protein [Nocardiopsis alba]|uniref:hypothetical protein n=1 Tax=Nocardiopsis alba TaxID=53437 RepID=UPI0033B9D64C
MTMHYYRADAARSRAWLQARDHIFDLRKHAIQAFNDRNAALLCGAYLHESPTGRWAIYSYGRPPGCCPHPRSMPTRNGASPWVPDRRTRIGRMLEEQIDGLPTTTERAWRTWEAIGPLGGLDMLYLITTPELMRARQVVLDQVLHIGWSEPLDLDPQVWVSITQSDFEEARAAQEHQTQVARLEAVTNRMTLWTYCRPDLLEQLRQIAVQTLRDHRDDRARVRTVLTTIRPAEHLLNLQRHGKSDEDVVPLVAEALNTLAGRLTPTT